MSLVISPKLNMASLSHLVLSNVDKKSPRLSKELDNIIKINSLFIVDFLFSLKIVMPNEYAIIKNNSSKNLGVNNWIPICICYIISLVISICKIKN